MLRKLILIVIVLSLGAVLISPFTDVDDAIHHHQQHHHQFALMVQHIGERADLSALSISACAVPGAGNEAAQRLISTLRC
ncbi:MAG TPA: hypothetical protein VFP40_00860 [Terriglobales bacterium]|nr:hypothetical protein [Terriglobales bacterium]